MKTFVWAAGIMWRQYRRHTLLVLATALVFAVCVGIYPILWQKLIDSTTWDSRHVLFFFGLMCVFLTPFPFLPRERLVARYRRDASCSLFSHLLTLDAYGGDKKSTERLMEAKNGVDAGANILSQFLTGQILVQVPVAVWAMYYIGCHSVWAVIMLVTFMLAFMSVSSLLGQRIGKVKTEEEKLKNKRDGYFREMLVLLSTIKIHQTESFENKHYAQDTEKAYGLEKKTDSLSACFNMFEELSFQLPYLVALVIFLPMRYESSISIGELMALVMYSTRAVAPVGYLGKIYQDLKQEEAKLKPALEMLQKKPQVIEAPDAIDVGCLQREIKLTDATFTHQKMNRGKPALRKVSLSIPAGQKIAIIGRSGCGKTTLAKAIARLFDLEQGSITFDGTDLRQISLASLHRQVYLVTQEMPVFSSTIRENIAYGTSASDDEILEACHRAKANFVFDLPSGLDTDIGELGDEMSGGERQRIVLARIFLRRPSVIILDEPASALDPWMEREISIALDDLLAMNGDTTMIVITHRMGTARKADQIVVMENGGISDIGTHDDLLSRCELYQQFCEI